MRTTLFFFFTVVLCSLRPFSRERAGRKRTWPLLPTFFVALFLHGPLLGYPPKFWTPPPPQPPILFRQRYPTPSHLLPPTRTSAPRFFPSRFLAILHNDSLPPQSRPLSLVLIVSFPLCRFLLVVVPHLPYDFLFMRSIVPSPHVSKDRGAFPNVGLSLTGVDLNSISLNPSPPPSSSFRRTFLL